MYVRTAYATGDPAKIDEALDRLTVEAIKLLADQPGYRGYGLFADRELGKITMGSWWDSEQADRDSDEQLKERREHLLAPFAASVVVDHWEAAVATPRPAAQPGAGFRLGRLEFDPADADRLIETFRTRTLPSFEAVPGFAGTALLIDRRAGRASVGTLWETHDALVASRGPQAAARQAARQALPITVRSLEEFEVVLLDRRDPPES